MSWKLEKKIRNGHAFWRDDFGRVAVTDDSISRRGDPSSTDDGLILVDLEALRSMPGLRGTDETYGLTFAYPVRTRDGEPASCAGGVVEAAVVAQLVTPPLPLFIDDKGERFEIRKVG